MDIAYGLFNNSRYVNLCECCRPGRRSGCGALSQLHRRTWADRDVRLG